MATAGSTETGNAAPDATADRTTPGLARFAELVDSVDAILWEADPATWRFTFVSSHAETLLGYPCAQWLTEPDFWKNHLHPADRDWAVRLCAAAVEEGRDHSLEYRFIASNGHARWLRDIVRVIREDGRVVQLRGVMIDVTERHRAEERAQWLAAERNARAAAEEAHRRFAEMVRDLNAIVWEADPDDWQFTFVSEGADRILGIPAHQLMDDVECLRSVLHADDREAWDDLKRVCAEGEDVNELTCRAQTADGRTVWLHTIVRTVRNGDGDVKWYRGVMVDITREKEAVDESERLRRSLENHNLFVEAALRQIPVGLAVFDVRGRVTLSSDAWHTLAARALAPDDPGSGRRFRRCEPSGERTEVESPVRRALDERRTIVGEELLIEADETETALRISAAPVVDEKGDVLGAVLAADDIEEVRRLQRELREREERLELIAGTVPVQIWTAQPSGRLDYINERVIEYFGRSRDAILTDGWRRDIHPDDRQRVRERVSRSLANGEELLVELRLRRANGSYRWHVSQAVPQFDDEGRIICWFGTNTDIDERRRAEQELRDRQDREHFIAESSRVFAGTLDRRAALREAAALALPLLGDFCSIDMIAPDDTVEQIAWRHISPSAAAWHADVQAALPPQPAREHLVGLLAARGTPIFLPEMPNADPAIDDDALRFLRPLTARSIIAVPLRIGSDIVGAATFGVSESARRFTESDLELAQAFADRASLAIENTRLFETARDNGERLRAALDASDTGTFRWDLDSGTIHGDERLARLAGRSGEIHDSAEDFLHIVHEDDRARIAHSVRRAIGGGTDFSEEFRIIWPDGSVHWIAKQGRIQNDEQGRPSSVIGACVDVTERRRREERFRALAETIPQLVWIADADGSIFWYNQRWYDFTGLTFDDLQGWGWQQVHHPEHVQRVTSGMRSSFESGEPWEDTFQLRAHDGTWHWFLARARPVRDAHGHIELWFGTHTDITELREAELARDRALRETQAERERLYDLFRLAPAAIAVVEGDEHTVRVANSPFFRLVGNRRLFGRPLTEALPELEGQELLTLLDRAHEHGHPLTRSELKVRIQPRADAEPDERTLDIVVQPLRDTERNVFAAMIHAVDVTTRVRATEELAIARAEAERANATKSAFLATLSHDLRTPLTAVNGYANLMLEGIYGEISPRQDEALRRICRANQHLLALIEDILHFAKLEAGSVDLNMEDIDIPQALSQVEPLITPQIEAKGLQFVSRVPHDIGRVRADRERLTQILVNLLTNAVKFTHTGTVSLDAEEGDHAVSIRVRDTGSGIDPEQLAIIFKPFVQAGVRTGAREGIGLGLAISRQLARAMDGDLTVTSEQGRGSTFTLTLPRP